MSDTGHLALLRHLRDDRWFAHRHLFAHRHQDESPEAHRELVAAINGPYARLSVEGFRGIGKSTYLEETAILKAVFREFHNMVIVGASLPRAADRLGAIKNEIEINPFFEYREDAPERSIFGKLRGEVWSNSQIVLANGVTIQAIGRDQSMTGMKFREWRPDAFLIDDIEDPEEKRTDSDREETWRWLMQTFFPSLDRPLATWGRFLGTRRGKNSLPERLERSGIKTVKFPVEYMDESGERRATWPAKFPLATIDALRATYAGDMDTYMQEYMCEATSAADRTFKREMFRLEPRIRSWEAVQVAIDPARTIRATSAATGWAAWSWMRNRLIVWASGAPIILPDEIVALAFDLAERFDPVWVGIEQDGLAEFLLQPLRQEQVRRGATIPYRGIMAPRDKKKEDFIRGLQPFFAAGEVIFAQPQPDLEAQLISFPSGKNDAANALAYALLMRPGAPIYDGFQQHHIVPDLSPGRSPLFLAANATGAMTSAVLVQAEEGGLTILADWVFEGPPAERVADIAAAAALVADSSRMVARPRSWDAMLKGAAPEYAVRQGRIGWVVPAHHNQRLANVGLMQAIRHLPAELRPASEGIAGSLYLREALGRTAKGFPAVEISPAARWTLRGLAGGYTRAMIRGRLQDYAEDGPYKVLMEGLEAFCGLVSVRRRAGVDDADDDNRQVMRLDERTGVRYASAMPSRRTR